MKRMPLLILAIILIGIFAFLLNGQLSQNKEKIITIDLYYYDWEKGGDGYLDGDYKPFSKDYSYLDVDKLLFAIVSDLNESQNINYISMFPNDAKINSVKLLDTEVVIDFSKEDLHGSSSQELGMLKQILRTFEGLVKFEEFSNIKTVYFTIDGENVYTLMGHIDISRSFVIGDEVR